MTDLFPQEFRYNKCLFSQDKAKLLNTYVTKREPLIISKRDLECFFDLEILLFGQTIGNALFY